MTDKPGINMPDHPIRQKAWYQAYVRLARPTLDWIGNAGAAYALVIGHAIGKAPPESYAVMSLIFIGGLYGVRTYEKRQGVA